MKKKKVLRTVNSDTFGARGITQGMVMQMYSLSACLSVLVENAIAVKGYQ